MTNEQKIKAYLEAGHYVKVNLLIDDSITIVYDNGLRFISSDGSTFYYDDFDYNPSVEPIPRKPNYKVWDKVVVLEIAREVNEYSSWDDCEKEQIWKVWSITKLANNWAHKVENTDGGVWLPSWAIAPAFDDDKPTKIQELESQLAQIQKEIELLKK